MNRQEQAERNLDQAQEFLTWLLDTPQDSWPPDGATVVFTPDNDPELTEANRQIMARVRHQDPDSTIVMVNPNMDRGVGVEGERAKDERRRRAAG